MQLNIVRQTTNFMVSLNGLPLTTVSFAFSSLILKTWRDQTTRKTYTQTGGYCQNGSETNSLGSCGLDFCVSGQGPMVGSYIVMDLRVP
jgi:hypothetical protein